MVPALDDAASENAPEALLVCAASPLLLKMHVFTDLYNRRMSEGDPSSVLCTGCNS